ncbi:hypothetical protein [Streptomyces californicus]|uniref:hypothetical protein n=1 Tax=Streptomyces californicus TaxID=67351 RepID=UPI003712D6FE
MSLLVIDRLDPQEQEPYATPVLVAAVVVAAVDQFTQDTSVARAALLAEAGRLLASRPFSDELQVIGTTLAAPKEAARRVRGRVRSLARSSSATAPWRAAARPLVDLITRAKSPARYCRQPGWPSPGIVASAASSAAWRPFRPAEDPNAPRPARTHGVRGICC